MALSTPRMIIKSLLRHPDIIPVVGAVGTACVIGCGMMIYTALVDPEVKIRQQGISPHEYVEPTSVRQFWVPDKKIYKPIPELEKLREELGPAKS